MENNSRENKLIRDHASTLLVVVGALFALAHGTIAHAAGNPEAGKAAAAVCMTCHGPRGVSLGPLWPNLAGQKVDYLVKQLKDFRAEERKNPLMSPQAKNLSNADIENLAAFFSSLPAGGAEAAKGP